MQCFPPLFLCFRERLLRLGSASAPVTTKKQGLGGVRHVHGMHAYAKLQ